MGAAVFGVKTIFFREKNCMVWNKTYYEEDEYEALKNTAGVGSLNQEVMDSLEKIIVCDTTTFFRNGNENHPFNVVWKSSIKK